MDFNNKVLWIVKVGGVDVWITETIFNTWIIMGFLFVFALFVRLKLNSFKKVPSGFQNFIELAVESMHNFTAGTMGEEYAYFGNYFFGLFIFILCANLSGLVYLRPPTADLATTLPFALTTVFLLHYMGIVKGKKQYFKAYLEPMPLFLPLNIIGELARPISLSFRMFGNILGGAIMLGLVYAMFPPYLKIAIPSFLHIYFDLFAGVLQAFIFCILSMTFIREKIPE